ncbi:MAG: hypothetical protein KGZ52_10190 [Xanthomonadaceae bacterium]|jgi:hypothetical protein|nr:hypothetical protein [Xanthomonadaceae bacterium]
MKVLSWLRIASVVSVVMLSLPLAAQIDTLRAVSCDACSEQQRIQEVTAVAASPGGSQVYVIDAAAASLRLYDVWIDKEPGLFHVTVREAPVPATAAAAFAEVLQRIPMIKGGSMTMHLVPSGCVSEGTSFAANHVSDETCRSHTYGTVRNSFQNSAQGWVRGPLQQALTLALTRTPQGPRVVRVVVRTPDGSTIDIDATIGIDIQGNLILTEVRTVRAHANGIDLPLRASDLRGRTFTSTGAAMFADFRRMFSNWSVDSGSKCSTRQRIVCPPDPGAPCISYITCEPPPP